MGMFKNRMPRGFHYTPRFYDPKREKWQKVEEDAKRRLGIIPPKEVSSEDIRGKFVEGTTHLKRRKEAGKRCFTSLHLIIILLLLLFLLNFLVSSNFSFA